MALLVWLLKHPKDADTESLYAADEVALVLRYRTAASMSSPSKARIASTESHSDRGMNSVRSP
jgi:hypothetical protein